MNLKESNQGVRKTGVNAGNRKNRVRGCLSRGRHRARECFLRAGGSSVFVIRVVFSFGCLGKSLGRELERFSGGVVRRLGKLDGREIFHEEICCRRGLEFL